jgi:TRAP-type mannitol/chloroaromatic compound transport system permease large subunit
MVLVFVLGFFFDWIEICLIVLPVFAPVLQGLDFSPHLGQSAPVVFLTWFIIMMSVNLQTSCGIIPFVLLQLAGLVLMIVFPQLALWLPRAVGFLD